MSLFDRLNALRARGRVGSTRPAEDRRPGVDDSLREMEQTAAEGRYADALTLVRAGLVRSPDRPELIALRGSILFEWGRFREANEDLATAISKGIDRPTLLLQSGWASLWSGDAPRAEAAMRRAIEADPGNWQPYFGLGGALRALRRFDEAIVAYERALVHSPDNVDCLLALLGCDLDARRLDDAFRVARRLRDTYPDDLAALAAYGGVLIWNDRFADAIAVYETIAGLDAVRADSNRMPLDAGFAMREGGRVDASVAFYEQYLPSQPNPNAHLHYSFSLLKAGRVADGFDHYDFRWMVAPLLALRPRLGKPVWTGQPIDGKTILVLDEQGFGDIIQFARYLPLVKARGARVVLLLRRSIGELIDARCGVDQVVTPSDALPEFDFHVHLVGLPRVFGTDLDTIPSEVPYVFAKPERVAQWRERIPADGMLKVGIAWAGDPQGGRGRQKSVPFAELAPWTLLNGVRFYSLQKGDAATDATNAPQGLPLVNLSPDIRDFADTAAIIDCLDLVISVCTSVTHLAGAMGKPTWTMLAEPADWRWMEGRDDSPWYPTMRLFRQATQGDWKNVVSEVGEALAALARDRGPAAATMDSRDQATQPLPSTKDSAASAAVMRQPRKIASLCIAVEARHGIFEVRQDGNASERALAYYGEDLEAQLALLRTRIAPGATVLEAGSGVGAHTVPLAAHLGEGGHLMICEPHAEVAAILHNNVSANAVRGVTVLRTNLLGAACDVSSDAAMDDNSAPIDRLDLRKLDWIKIGEGVDADAVLRGASDTLWALRPCVFAAVAGEVELDRLAGRLRDFGYHCWRVDTPRFRAENFNRRDDDVFGGDVAYAILAIPEESTAAPPAGLKALD